MNQITFSVEIKKGIGTEKFPSCLTSNIHGSRIICHGFFSEKNYNFPVYLKTSLSTCPYDVEPHYHNLIAVGHFQSVNNFVNQS